MPVVADSGLPTVHPSEDPASHPLNTLNTISNPADGPGKQPLTLSSPLWPFWRPPVGYRNPSLLPGSRSARRKSVVTVIACTSRAAPSVPVTKSGDQAGIGAAGCVSPSVLREMDDQVHTVASEDAIALRAGTATVAEPVSRRTRVTLASIDAQVWRVTYISDVAGSSDHIGVHGGLDARRGAGSICPTMESSPTGAALGRGERDRDRAAFERLARNGSESPQPARLAGEARADRRWRLGSQTGKGDP